MMEFFNNKELMKEFMLCNENDTEKVKEINLKNKNNIHLIHEPITVTKDVITNYTPQSSSYKSLMLNNHYEKLQQTWKCFSSKNV